MRRLQPRLDAIRRRQADRALTRQLAYQRDKARARPDDSVEMTAALRLYAQSICERIGAIRPLDPSGPTLEIGSGAHGLVFFAGLTRAVGVDPLARHYAKLFPKWQSRVPTLDAVGEALPFADGAFELVLSDNVVDHALQPERILAEAARVLRPGGILYFTVNVHHRFWSAASRLHRLWNGLGFHYEIAPFADHTVHLTPSAARVLVTNQPFTIVSERLPIAEMVAADRQMQPRHMGDLAKWLFFKNVQYEIIARRR